jgi:hypothetical protein
VLSISQEHERLKSVREAEYTTSPCGLKRCFGMETAIITAFASDPVGNFLQDLIYQGGVDQSLVR